MAKYYLGKNQDGLFVPITIPNVGTGIKEVIDYTTSFVDEQELRNSLLSNGLIDKYNTELAYLKEEGTKENKTYKIIDLGHHICTITSKEYFKEDRIKNYLYSKYYDRDFFVSLAAHYIRRLKVDNLLEELLKNNRRSGFYMTEFLQNLFLANIPEIRQLSRDLMIIGRTLPEEEHQAKMEELIKLIETNNEALVMAYRYFKPDLEIKYASPIDNAVKMIMFAKRYGDLEEISSQLNNKLMRDIESLAASIMYTYDSKEKCYKKEGNKFKIRERGLVDLGLFISTHEEYLDSIRLDSRNTGIEYDEEHEEFLEEADFDSIGTTSEREGFSLRKRDIDRK